MKKILIVYDIDYEGPNGKDGWCYYRRAKTLQKYAPEDLHIDILSQADAKNVMLARGNYDLLFILDYMSASAWKQRANGAKVPMVVSFNKDARSRQQEWETTLTVADFVIVNNQHRWKRNSPNRKLRTCCISNGVDLDVFRYDTPISDRPYKSIWSGGTGAKKKKGYSSLLLPIQDVLKHRELPCELRPIYSITPEQVWDEQQMNDWYNSASFALCASETEGSPNSSLEGMACGCIPITTNVGHVPELISHGHNGMICDPTVDSFVECIESACSHREEMSANCLETIKSWSYGPPGNRAQWFYQLFRRITKDVHTINPFCYKDTHWEEI